MVNRNKHGEFGESVSSLITKAFEEMSGGELERLIKANAELADLVTDLQDRMAMADNRLEAALAGDDVCKDCVETARSYLAPIQKP